MFRHLPVDEHAPSTLIEPGQSMVQGLENGQLDKPLGTAWPTGSRSRGLSST
jgi:hypothetical protein